MTLVDLGIMLREGRLRRNLTVDEVATCLKISPRLIRDLEAGNSPSLPHAVYVRGFIKSYAKLLDIGPEELEPGLAFYEQQEPAEINQNPTTAVQPPQRSGWGLKILVLLCAIAFGGYWYYNTQVVRPRAIVGENLQTLPTSAPPLPPAAAPAGSANGTGLNSGTSNVPTAGQGGQAALTPQTGQAGQPEQVAQLAQTAQPSRAGQAQPSAPAGAPSATTHVPPAGGGAAAPSRDSGGSVVAPVGQLDEQAPVHVNGFKTPDAAPLNTGTRPSGQTNVGIPRQDQTQPRVNQLVLTGEAECWVHATADDTDTRQFSIKKGETFALSFSKKLVLKLGNAGGVRLKYNGEEMPPPGTDGQVRTLTLP